MSDQIKKLAPIIWSEIQKAHKILLVIHTSPDLDSIGSNLAMKLALDSLGKETLLVSGDDEVNTERLFFLKPPFPEIAHKKFSDINLAEIDLYIALDIAILKKISDQPIPSLPIPVKTINIDHHHKDNPMFGDINLITKDSSTSEILLNLFETWKLNINPQVASCLFVGTVSDTGGLKHPVTTYHTYQNASKLIKAGADFNKVFYTVESQTTEELRVIGLCLSRIENYFGGKVVITYLLADDLKKMKIPDKTLGSIHKPTLYQMSKIPDSFIQIFINGRSSKGMNTFGISLRGNNKAKLYDVSTAGRVFGGGGHKQAASGELKGTLDSVKKTVLDTIGKIYPDLGQP